MNVCCWCGTVECGGKILNVGGCERKCDWFDRNNHRLWRHKKGSRVGRMWVELLDKTRNESWLLEHVSKPLTDTDFWVSAERHQEGRTLPHFYSVCGAQAIVGGLTEACGGIIGWIKTYVKKSRLQSRSNNMTPLAFWYLLYKIFAWFLPDMVGRDNNEWPSFRRRSVFVEIVSE